MAAAGNFTVTVVSAAVKVVAYIFPWLLLIVGFIANDRMFVVLDRFFNGEITTDIAIINSLSALKLGKHYVAITEKACKNIKIINEKILNEQDRALLKTESEHNCNDGIALAEEI